MSLGRAKIGRPAAVVAVAVAAARVGNTAVVVVAVGVGIAATAVIAVVATESQTCFHNGVRLRLNPVLFSPRAVRERM